MIKMTYQSYSLVLGLILASLSNVAFSKDYSVGMKIGTLGIGLELTKPIKSSLDLRLGINHIEAKVNNFRIGSIQYDIDASANSINAVLDWYPQQNNKFYFSGGVLLGDDNINPSPNPNFTFRGIEVGKALDRYDVNFKIDYANIAPYFSMGYSNKNSKKKGWYYAGDLGIAYLGKAKASFHIIDKTTNLPPAIIPQIELDREIEKINNKLDDYKIWPILSFTWNYQF